MDFLKEEEGIYLLKVPFEEIYTSVFALVNEAGVIILDTATYDSDVTDYIEPAIRRSGFEPAYIVITHTHSDHHGGLAALSDAFPLAKVALMDKKLPLKREPLYLKDGDALLGRFEILNLRGHSEDSIGVYDRETKTLLSGDSLQQLGIGKYRGGVIDKAEYKKTLDRVENMDIERIIFSHDYDPCGYSARGKTEIKKALDICRSVL